MTSSIRVAQVFPKLAGKKTRSTLKNCGGRLIYIINYALCLAHYDAYFNINDYAETCRYFSVTSKFIFSNNSF